MDKKLTFSLLALIALLFLSGCRSGEQEAPDTVKTVRFRAAAADTRTAFSEALDGKYATRWTVNDREVLLSLNYAEAQPSAVTASADGETASFEASFDASAASAPYIFYAVSPASAARAISPSRKAWSVYIAADQTPSAGSVDEEAQLLVAKSASSATLPDEVALHFSHLTAYGRISLKNLSLGSAQVQKAELVFDTPVVGEWYWGEEGTLTSKGASHTITLETDASGDLWFACAPVSVGGTGMTLTLHTDQGILRKEISFPEGRSFASGKVARFSVDMAGIDFIQEDVYVRVTDASTLQKGDSILIVNADGTYALGGQKKTNAVEYRLQAAVETKSGRIADPGAATVLRLEEGCVPGTWSLHTGAGYLSAGRENNMLKEVSIQDYFSSWIITVAPDGFATVKAKSSIPAYIRYDAQNSRFISLGAETDQQGIVLYRLSQAAAILPDDPLTASQELGAYLADWQRTYVRGADQVHRSYGADGKLVFVLLNAATREQLVISGYDPALTKGDDVTVTVDYRIGEQEILEGKTFSLQVAREDGSKVWLGNGSGLGFILKK